MAEKEDLFKPLYKSHRRVRFDDVLASSKVFDPQTAILSEDTSVRIGSYTLRKYGQHEWKSDEIPGLRILSGTLSSQKQATLIHESLESFLADPAHLTNLDAHFELSRPIRLFNSAGHAEARLPDSKASLVRDKLRWVTLGGQYNWTKKVYPSFEPGTPGCPQFPESLAKDISTSFGMNAEAAIVNYYSDGDILSPHQDVAELVSRDLVSISLGCACIFYIGMHRYGEPPLEVLLRSGDIVVMGGHSRGAFHGVGRVFQGTTPTELLTSVDPTAATWVAAHRVNINIRQMK